MMNLVKTTVVASFVLFSSITFAAGIEKEMVEVTSDIDKEVAKLVYVIDEDSRVLTNLYIDSYINNKRTKRQEVDTSTINGKGIILHQKDKYVTVRLYSHNFDVTQGGVLYLDTLYSGVSGERREYEIDVTMENDLAIMKYKKQAFTKMHFKAKRAPIVGPIGIEKVTFSK